MGHGKETPRQKMIGMMYLVLTALLALNVSKDVLNAFEKYMDENKKKVGNGFTLYTDFYLGYHFNFFKGRFFFEPAIGISYWPLRTGVPDSFKAVEQKWPNYFIQPGLDFGFNF